MRRPYNIGCGSNTGERESSLSPAPQRGSPLRPFDPLMARQAREVEAEPRDAGTAGGRTLGEGWRATRRRELAGGGTDLELAVPEPAVPELVEGSKD